MAPRKWTVDDLVESHPHQLHEALGQRFAVELCAIEREFPEFDLAGKAEIARMRTASECLRLLALTEDTYLKDMPANA